MQTIYIYQHLITGRKVESLSPTTPTGYRLVGFYTPTGALAAR